MLKPILWKEWREQRWKMLFGTLLLSFITSSSGEMMITVPPDLKFGIWGLGGMLLSLYSAMGVFAPEQTNHTKIFLVSKPLSSWRIFFCKWLKVGFYQLLVTLGLQSFVNEE